MARLGISRQAVFHAAAQLVAQGKEPTIEQIRLILKTGSNSTIAGHLREWRAIQRQDETAPLSNELPVDMLMQMKALWERLTTEAGETVEVEVSKYQQVIDDMKLEVEKFQFNNRRWQQLFLQWQQEKKRLEEENQHLTYENNQLHKEKITLQTKLEAQTEQLLEKRLRIEELHRLHLQAQANLRQFYESALEQRREYLFQYEEEKKRWLEEIKTQKEQLALLQEHTNSIQDHYQALQLKYESLSEKYLNTQEQLLFHQQQNTQLKEA